VFTTSTAPLRKDVGFALVLAQMLETNNRDMGHFEILRPNLFNVSIDRFCDLVIR
jgi:hypothetical protein